MKTMRRTMTMTSKEREYKQVISWTVDKPKRSARAGGGQSGEMAANVGGWANAPRW